MVLAQIPLSRIREYELVIILRPSLGEEGVQERIDHVSRNITSRGGEMLAVEVWGKRRLAYPIQKNTEGVYVLLRLKVAPTAIEELEGQIRLDEVIVRHLFVRVEG